MMKKLITSIDKFLAETGIASTTFGRLAVNDGKLVQRLRDGGEVLPSTEKKIINFIKLYGGK